MAQNNTNEYRKFRYYEGVCAAGDFVKEIAKVLSLGVKETYIDSNGQKQTIPMRVKNWDIVYPTVDSSFDGYEHINTRDKYFGNTNDPDDGIDKYYTRFTEKLENQINQITNNVVLKTTTTARDANLENDDLSVSGDSDLAQTTMYVQIYKPNYLANPEEYPLDAELKGLTPQLITKEMYKEARKSTASVIYDLAQLADNDNVNDKTQHSNLVKKSLSNERVDAVSDPISSRDLYGANLDSPQETSDGYLSGLKNIFATTYISQVIGIPDQNNREASCTLVRSQLNQIKQTEPKLYKYLFSICGSKTAFTESDYDLIQEMTIKVSCVDTETSFAYVVTLTFEKTVEIYTIQATAGKNQPHLDVLSEYGHEALENIKPELYSEGRYVPLPDKYLDLTGDLSTHDVTFSKTETLRFCLDKISDESVLYGTIVLRFNYDKKVDYTDLSSLQITDSVALENNHYCLIRMFDNPNADFSGPEPNIQDNKGNITVTNSHTSPWSKLSWYQDFEEIMMDHIDEDVSVTSVTDGTLLVPLETAGLTSDTRISYWVNTNNDRVSLVVMGNPALDYERDRHLISSCYIGRIDSFENSINDVSGNFALYTSSSTTPCKTVMDSYATQYHINADFVNGCFVDGAIGMANNTEHPEYASKYPNATGRSGNIEEYIRYSHKIGGEQECSQITDLGLDVYYITLTGNKFFNENEFPRYMVVNKNTNEPLPLGDNVDSLGRPVYYDTVAYRTFIYGVSDTRSNQVAVYINPKTFEGKNKSDYKVYFNFGYYEEKFVITSGITRDTFGNVVGIETIDDFGKNTSDGVTSVSMYHTRSKAFYQKHHFLFATTEEYMSKVMYGKSSYTGEYYADRIKITHGNDGPRGVLCDTLVIDSSSLYPKDELVINKDFSKSPEELEETFTYFPITAPYSPLSDGPNARYGIALKKSEREPEYKDSSKLIQIGKNELIAVMGNSLIIDDDINLPHELSNGCKVYWSVKEGSNWIASSDGENREIVLADGTVLHKIVKGYDADNVYIALSDTYQPGTDTSYTPAAIDFTITKGATKTNDFKSEIVVTPPSGGFDPSNEVTHVYYAYSDAPLTGLTGGTKAFEIMDDGTRIDNIHKYAYDNDKFITIVGYPISLEDITEQSGTDAGKITSRWTQELFNAHPDKYLNIFFTKDDMSSVAGVIYDAENNTETEVYDQLIKSYVSVPLHNPDYDKTDNTQYALGQAYFDLLQYPCSVTVYASDTTSANNGIYINGAIQQRQEYQYYPYNKALAFTVKNLAGQVKITKSHYSNIDTDVTISGTTVNIPATKMLDDLFVSVAERA